jgi:two-component system response regulator VanR
MEVTVTQEWNNQKMDNRRVLIIDDDKSTLRFFTLILQRKGYSVDVVETGKEALEKISSQFYDVALIDVVLPDMNGLELLKSIPSNTKKIVMTGATSEENHTRAQTEGADAYLLKPIKPEKLLQIIANSLS